MNTFHTKKSVYVHTVDISHILRLEFIIANLILLYMNIMV